MTTTPDLPFAPAAERNRGPILEALTPRLSPAASVLEIGAGTGQHAVAFSRALPGLRWQPTDRRAVLPSLAARVKAEGRGGVLEPLALDVDTGPWPEGPFDAVFTANTAHILPWESVCRMLAGAAGVMRPDGRLFVYGPFRRDGRHTSDGNERFDRTLREDDPSRGIRDLEALESAAVRLQLNLEEVLDMPANNLMLVFRRDG